MENNIDNSQNEINDNMLKLAQRKEIERAKKMFLNKRNILIFVIIFVPIFLLVSKYKLTPAENTKNTSNANPAPIVVEDSNKSEDADIEKSEKIKIISDVLGSHQIRFAGHDLKLKGFFNPEDDIMLTIYSDDILNYQQEREIAIYQYQNKISASELFDKELLYQAKSSYNAKYLKTNQYNDNYLIILSDFNYDSSSATLSLIKIFEKDGHTYKISYQKAINNDVLNVARNWVGKDYKILVDEFNDIDVFSDIDLSYAQKVFNDSLKIKENLSKNNAYTNIKWETKTINESNSYADINLEYPEFKGFSSASNLNKIITDIILGTLEEDRKLMEDWKKDKKNSYTDDEGNVISDCYGDQDYFYNCSINLYSSFKVKSIINDIISIEIILTDYTGGGNGNHSYPVTIMYDLKNNKQLFIDDIFCGNDYLNKVKEVLRANLITGSVFDNSLGYLTDEVLLSHLRESSFNDFGLTLSFSPYIFTPGAAGIYHVFIPYTLLENNVCFKGFSNDEISIKRNLLGLDVPAKLSDSCGFMADDCEMFSFYEGKFNEPGSYDFTSDKAYILTSFNDYKTGNLLENKGYTQIILVPYTWVWASSGNGLYVIKKNGNNLDIVSRIDVGKRPPENLRIENNKIYFNSTNLDESDNSQECYFKDNKLEEKNLVCK